MTDRWDAAGAGGTGEEDFGEDFFASLEAAPDADAFGALDGADGPDEFLYESEGDGSFETDAADDGADEGAADGDPEAPEEFDADDFPFDLGGEG
ncbi:hypothetical protein GCM10009830_22380 [Glycomyces endophyticus]|uniref:Uncharacterized protein n=1 Tax=Glycomyces endophyticus TaxID=480996 RepID=A0ABN2GQR0_9ACTN